MCMWRQLFKNKYCTFYLCFHKLISLIYYSSEFWVDEYFKYSEQPLNIPQFKVPPHSLFKLNNFLSTASVLISSISHTIQLNLHTYPPAKSCQKTFIVKGTQRM
jgi:hypothetical protein